MTRREIRKIVQLAGDDPLDLILLAAVLLRKHRGRRSEELPRLCLVERSEGIGWALVGAAISAMRILPRGYIRTAPAAKPKARARLDDRSLFYVIPRSTRARFALREPLELWAERRARLAPILGAYIRALEPVVEERAGSPLDVNDLPYPLVGLADVAVAIDRARLGEERVTADTLRSWIVDLSAVLRVMLGELDFSPVMLQVGARLMLEQDRSGDWWHLLELWRLGEPATLEELSQVVHSYRAQAWWRRTEALVKAGILERSGRGKAERRGVAPWVRMTLGLASLVLPAPLEPELEPAKTVYSNLWGTRFEFSNVMRDARGGNLRPGRKRKPKTK